MPDNNPMSLEDIKTSIQLLAQTPLSPVKEHVLTAIKKYAKEVSNRGLFGLLGTSYVQRLQNIADVLGFMKSSDDDFIREVKQYADTKIEASSQFRGYLISEMTAADIELQGRRKNMEYFTMFLGAAFCCVDPQVGLAAVTLTVAAHLTKMIDAKKLLKTVSKEILEVWDHSTVAFTDTGIHTLTTYHRATKK